MSSHEKNNKFIKRYENIKSMLEAREIIFDLDENPTSFSELKKIFKNKVFDSKNDIDDKTMVFMPLELKLGVGNLKNVLNKLDINDAKNAIVIIEDSATPAAKSNISLLLKNKTYITVFNYDEIGVNILKHEYQPKSFKVLNSKEIQKEITPFYSCNKLPGMLLRDPVSKWLNLKKHQIVRIEREDGIVYKQIR